MPAESKKLPAVFYRTGNGVEPVREWLRDDVSPEERKVVGKDIAVVEYGWPIGMPTCRPPGGGLFEIRSDLPGNRIARVLFCATNGRLVLLHGFIKKTHATPATDLAIGRARQKGVMS